MFRAKMKAFIDTVVWYFYFIKVVYGRWDKEPYREEIEYLRKEGYKQARKSIIIPYELEKRYNPDMIKVYEDNDVHAKYILTNGKRLYFPGSYANWIAKKSANLMREQDIKSPHRYYDEGFYPTQDEIFIDVGAADGKEALEIVDTVKEVVLYENDEVWIKALRNTFRKWNDKVKIVKSFVSNYSDGNEVIKLDDIYTDYGQKYFIKMDVEGNEKKVLEGAKELLSHAAVRIVLTTYHKLHDYNELKMFLENVGYTCECSKGWLLIFDKNLDDHNIDEPYFRRGVIRAANYRQ